MADGNTNICKQSHRLSVLREHLSRYFGTSIEGLLSILKTLDSELYSNIPECLMPSAHIAEIVLACRSHNGERLAPIFDAISSKVSASFLLKALALQLRKSGDRAFEDVLEELPEELFTDPHTNPNPTSSDDPALPPNQIPPELAAHDEERIRVLLGADEDLNEHDIFKCHVDDNVSPCHLQMEHLRFLGEMQRFSEALDETHEVLRRLTVIEHNVWDFIVAKADGKLNRSVIVSLRRGVSRLFEYSDQIGKRRRYGTPLDKPKHGSESFARLFRFLERRVKPADDKEFNEFMDALWTIMEAPLDSTAFLEAKLHELSRTCPSLMNAADSVKFYLPAIITPLRQLLRERTSGTEKAITGGYNSFGVKEITRCVRSVSKKMPYNHDALKQHWIFKTRPNS